METTNKTPVMDTPINAKIVELLGTTSWNNTKNNTTVYYHKLKLDNGETISIGKNNDTPFVVGNEIVYQNTLNSKGVVCQKEIKPNNSSSYKNNSKQVNAYSKQVALQAAAQLGGTRETIIENAEFFLSWLDK